MAERVSLGFIGLRMGINHLKAASSIAAARPLALCDLDDARLKEVAHDHRVAMTFTDYREMLELDKLDAVVVAIPNAFHEPVVTACLRAGKDVLCEKPPALNAALARRMHDQARRRKRLLVYGFQRRHYPSSRYVRKFIADGKAGDVYYAKAGWLRRRVPFSAWFQQKQLSGGGPLIDLGVHHLDLVLWLLGYPRPKVVLASTATKFGDYDVEDFATALITFSRGLTLHIENTQTSHIGPQEMEHLSLLGSKAGLSFNPLVVHTDRRGKQVDLAVTVEEDDWFTGVTRQMSAFARRVLRGDRSLEEASQGVALMKIIDAIYESARSGQSVSMQKARY